MKIYSLESILKDTSPAPEQIIGDGILLPESLLLISGEKKARKTFLAYNLGIALSSGHSFAGFEIKKKHRVLILSAEGGYYPNRERIQTMCNAINNGNELLLNVCFDPRLKLESDEDYDKIEELLIEHESEILIIDPFIKFHNLDENSAKDMGKVLDRLRMLINDYKIAIILVHHLGKNQTQGARGSSAILGEYDSSITLEKVGSDSDSRNDIKFELRHSISPERRELVFNKETNWFEEIFSIYEKILKERGEMSKKDLIDIAISRGIPQSTAYRKLSADEKDNKVIVNSNGKYSLPT